MGAAPLNARAASSFAPGKVILLGEHAVVYGHPALAAPIARGVRIVATPSHTPRVTMDPPLSAKAKKTLLQLYTRHARALGAKPLTLRVTSDLPPSMGLGSSGALAVALARLLLGEAASTKAVEKLAVSIEKTFHGTPSGVDHTTSARQQLLLFSRSRVRLLKPARPFNLVVALTDGVRSSTQTTVGKLRERMRAQPRLHREIFSVIGGLATTGAAAATRGDLELLGMLMNVNHGLLASLGLSSAPLDALVHRLRELGARGAKLTGAGGDGGAVIGLFDEVSPAIRTLRREGISCFASSVS